jgi:hypothetical protein
VDTRHTADRTGGSLALLCAGTIFAGLVAVLALVALVSILRANRRPV